MSTAKSKKKLVILAAAALIIAAIIFAVITGSRIQRIQNELDLGMRYLELWHMRWHFSLSILLSF